MANTQLHFSPVCPIPLVLDPKDRIRELKVVLSEDRWQFQKANILKLIELYESGGLQPPSYDTTIWLCNGKVLDKEPGLDDVPKGSVLWAEGRAIQMMQQSIPR